MPGILPMKVIKVGTSAQSRIAQACDRCRSKKIRCDGVTPCCSQCANVGFECKTSDKLSRRAFPRGYTESLEERVRALESEVRELKDLLDEKDEKIDMLSRIHSFSSPRRPSAISASSFPKEESGSSVSQSREDVFKVQQSPSLLDDDKRSEPYFMGASSGRVFVDAFKSRLQESGKTNSTFDSKAFFTPSSRLILTTPLTATQSDSDVVKLPGSDGLKVPPRLLSDQMINVFFQEWAPLFPVLHRPTFLKLYADYVANPTSIKDQHSIAQLHLVFGIAALSSE
ncbi:Transcriptional activator protein acu-15, partial [Xylographa pallens]|nr:Transcriptional activator protein acu-15 [Xylographa pallens]